MGIANQLQRQHLAQVTPYASARRSMSGGDIWLNANESPYCNDYSVTTESLNRYPAFQSTALNQAYADYAGVAVEQILSCRGSDEAIELLIRSFTEPGEDNIIICPPTYGMYAISAQTHGAGVIEVPLTADWQLDINAISARLADAKLVFLCSPSNPLGNSLTQQSLENILQLATETLVVVDEAYIEFAQQSSVASWLQRYPNLVVLRTLSKAFALAGTRCGFALARPDVLTVMRKVLAPYPLPDLTIQVATQALAPNGLSRLQQQVDETLLQRQWLLQQLEALPVNLVTSPDTNFILITVDNAEQLLAAVAEHGILLRNQSAQRSLSNCVRITVGNAAENQQLVNCLQGYLGVSL